MNRRCLGSLNRFHTLLEVTEGVVASLTRVVQSEDRIGVLTESLREFADAIGDLVRLLDLADVLARQHLDHLNLEFVRHVCAPEFGDTVLRGRVDSRDDGYGQLVHSGWLLQCDGRLLRDGRLLLRRLLRRLHRRGGWLLGGGGHLGLELGRGDRGSGGGHVGVGGCVVWFTGGGCVCFDVGVCGCVGSSGWVGECIVSGGFITGCDVQWYGICVDDGEDVIVVIASVGIGSENARSDRGCANDTSLDLLDVGSTSAWFGYNGHLYELSRSIGHDQMRGGKSEWFLLL